MRMTRWLGVAVSLTAAAAFAEGSPAERIDAARALVNAGKHKQALVEAEAVAALEGNPRPVVLGAWEVMGLAWGGLKKAPKAEAVFRRLLTLEPGFKLKGKVSPAASAAFKKAKRWVAQRQGGLVAEQLSPAIKDGHIVGVFLSIDGDATGLVKTVRAHLRVDGAAWAVKSQPAEGSTAIEVAGKAVQWWAELLGDHDAVLLTLGSEAEPFVDAVPGAIIRKAAPTETPAAGASKPVAKADAPTQLTLTPEPAAPGVEVTTKATPQKPRRVLPWVLVGAGLVSAGVGVGFGVASGSARDRIASASVNAESGLVTGMTRAQALEFQQKAQTDAVVANTLYGAGATLVAGGVLWWLLGED